MVGWWWAMVGPMVGPWGAEDGQAGVETLLDLGPLPTAVGYNRSTEAHKACSPLLRDE